MAGHDHDDHGHTLAAWTGVIIALIGFSAAGAFMIAAKPVPFWASMGVILLSPLAGLAMRMLGFGKKEQPAATVARAQAEEHAHAAESAPVKSAPAAEEEAHATA